MHLFAQPPLRADAKAVADDQHPYHQLGIDRRPTRLAVERPQLLANAAEVDETIDRAQQVISRATVLEPEDVESTLLHQRPPHHYPPSPAAATTLEGAVG